MGKPTGFLEIARAERTYDKPEARLKTWKEFVHPLSQTETVKQAVRAGLGISLLSEHTVRQELEQGVLAAVEVHPPPSGRPIVAAYRRERVLAPSENAFLCDLRDLNAWPNALLSNRVGPMHAPLSVSGA